MRVLNLSIILLALLQSSVIHAENIGKLSIVLDDLGYNRNDFQAFFLPKEISFSILPFTPFAKQLANKAHQQGREILLHIPMEAKTDNSKLGEGALMSGIPEDEFKATLTNSLDYLPYVQGINNHMGSALTEQIKPMQWVMEVLLKRGLYFIDSRTSAKSIAESIAKKTGVPTLRRHIFLDNIKTEAAMTEQFNHAIQLTAKKKAVIIIAHPYPETLNFLQQKFNEQTDNIKLSTLSQIIPKAQGLTMAQEKSLFDASNDLTLSHHPKPTQ